MWTFPAAEGHLSIATLTYKGYKKGDYCIITGCNSLEIENMRFQICIVLYLTFDKALAITNDKEGSQIVRNCPTWYLPTENDTCTCGSTVDGNVKCSQEKEQISLLTQVCITYTDEQLLLGECPYIHSGARLPDIVYTTVPQNVSEVNEFMCGSLNRTGLLCSQCQEGLSLAALSYRQECVLCSNPGLGVALFLILAFVPTTIFFLIVMACSIDVSSGPMNAALILVHITLARFNQNSLSFSNSSLVYNYIMFNVTISGILNLDFLRYIIPSFCINKSLTSLQTVALEYVVAVYPLLLIVVTYVCVELHSYKCRIILLLWDPFKRMLSTKCPRDFNLNHSLLKAFATFLILSYAKMFQTSRAILTYSNIKNSTGDTVKTVPFVDASITYMSATHIPYVIIAIFMMITFNLLPPLLFLLYPMKCFQDLLGKFPGVNWHRLWAFMDIFQGCYKNGTNGSRDFRYFAAFNLLFRIVMLIPMNSPSLILLKDSIVLAIAALLVAIARPYQRKWINLWEITIYSVFLLTSLWVTYSVFIKPLSTFVPVFSMTLLSLYIFFLYVAKMLKVFFPDCYNSCAERIQKWTEANPNFPCCCYHQRSSTANLMEMGKANIYASSRTDEDYPDRVNNPQDYEPLLLSKISVSEQFQSYGAI